MRMRCSIILCNRIDYWILWQRVSFNIIILLSKLYSSFATVFSAQSLSGHPKVSLLCENFYTVLKELTLRLIVSSNIGFSLLTVFISKFVQSCN